MRLIDADELLNDLIFPTEQFKKGFTEMINDAPTIEAEPVKHGHWVTMNGGGRGYADEFGCTNCSCVVKYGYFTKGCDYGWCPYCGAKMDEVEENE